MLVARSIASFTLVAVLSLNGCSTSRPIATNPAPPKPAEPATQPFNQQIPGTTLSFDMVPIPGGRFVMGSPAGEKHRKPDEGPQVEVEIEPFYMGKFEVTWDLYNEFLIQYNLLAIRKGERVPADRHADAVTYPTPIYDLEAGPMLQRMGGREAGHPAVIVSSLAAKQFTKWLSAKTGRFYRLPTEAEWEYAARAGTTTSYFFGDDAEKLDEYAWHYENAELADGDVGYHKVGQKKPNPFGLYDIYGNVAEIVIDQYDAKHYETLPAKACLWRSAVKWPGKVYPRVVRGGGYESDPPDLRSAARHQVTVYVNRYDPDVPKSPWWWVNGFDIGFRVVSPVKEPDAAEKHRFWDVDNDEIRGVLKRDRETRQLVDELKPK